MRQFIVEIHPKKSAFDPLASEIKSELVDFGESPSQAIVSTERLYRIEGDITPEQVEFVSRKLLVDPVTEDIYFPSQQKKEKKKTSPGFIVDVWPKAGVTDPVGETVEKGFRDLGVLEKVKAASAFRYVFPKVKNIAVVKDLAKRVLANELIHDISIR